MSEQEPLSPILQLDLPDEDATRAFAERLSPLLEASDWIALEGDLGAGKTAFTRALVNALPANHEMKGLKSDREEVPSPTFTLVQVYQRGTLELWHFDLYRIEDPQEVFELGIDEALATGVTVIEWPSRLGVLRERLLSGDGLTLSFEFAKEPAARRLSVKGLGRWVSLSKLLEQKR